MINCPVFLLRETAATKNVCPMARGNAEQKNDLARMMVYDGCVTCPGQRKAEKIKKTIPK